MRYLGDYAPSTVIYGKFTTYQPSTGAAFALAGSPALSVYKDNSTTQSTTGVTLTASFDSVTGLNHFAIDTSADGTFYSAGSNFDVVITTGTVDGVSVVGSVVGAFSINKVAALRPATAGRTFAVDSSGGAPVSVGTGSGQVNVSSGVVPANVTQFGGSNGTFASGIPAVNATQLNGTAQTGRDIGASVLLSSGTGTGQVSLSSGTVTVGTNNDKTGYTLSNTGIDAFADRSTTGHTTPGTWGGTWNAAGGAGDPWSTNLPGAYGSGTAGYIIGTNIDALISSRMASYTQPTGFLAATFPTGTVANTTNITAGTITTATNLTNAPTNGDFTATMKTSIGTAVAASAVASVTGNVGGNVTGSVGSVVGAVGSVTGNVGGTVNGLTATAQGNVRTALGMSTANLDTQLGTLATSTELAKVPKSDGTTTWNATALGSINAQVDTALADYDGPTNAEMVARTLAAADYATAANLATVDGVVDGILADTDNIQTRLPAALVGGRMDANVGAVNGSTVTGSGTEEDPWGPA